MRQSRALVVALGCLVLVAATAVLYQRGPGGVYFLPGCLFRKFTGLDCPGCGMTRATYAAIHGNFAQAFRFNPVGIVLLPIASLGLAFEIGGWVRGRPLPFRFNVGAKGAQVLMWTVLGFWVLRNVPYWPFTLLSPP